LVGIVKIDFCLTEVLFELLGIMMSPIVWSSSSVSLSSISV
jgi:hypothetical protein